MQIDKTISLNLPFRLRFTEGVFNIANDTLADAMPVKSNVHQRCIVFADSNVDAAFKDIKQKIATYFEQRINHVDLTAVHLIPGGEQCKNDRSIFEEISQEIAYAKICRQSYVITIGGGAVMDVVGFAASIAHRGVRLIRIPTTTLGQTDSGVAVKNAINAYDQKNYLGSFAVPWAVINDATFLTTLTDYDWISGFSEAVKVALLKDASFFDQIEHRANKIAARDTMSAGPIIEQSARLHLTHIVEGGDPFELTDARPLDLGHWAAHRIEQMSNYEITHGHAVAMGLAIDVTYTMLAGMMPQADCSRILKCLETLGFQLTHPVMKDMDALVKGIDQFREHLGGRLTIPLLKAIGQPIDVHEYDTSVLCDAIVQLVKR